MIGQKLILEDIDNFIRKNKVPRFMIISGSKGSGKTTLAKEIARKMKAYFIECELSVDAVREAVKNCYKCAGTTVYFFRNADKMSAAAKNALLKITEEPPRQAHFIITVQNSENMLETLRSRATNIKMFPYTPDELTKFYEEKISKKNPLIREVCHTPGLMLEMEKIKIDELISFCETVVDNIQQVTGVNAFKIVQRIRIKEDGEGYDPDLFFHSMKHVLIKRIIASKDHIHGVVSADTKKYSKMLNVTARYHHEMSITGIKKDSTLDLWVLEMREC